MKEEHHALYLAAAKATEAFHELTKERDEKRRKLIDAATSEINAAIHAEYGDRVDDLGRKRIAADKAVRDAEVADATKDAPWPIGTKLIGWGRLDYMIRVHKGKVLKL